eukprot:12899986-Prorocentrum_lima.AAC.1
MFVGCCMKWLTLAPGSGAVDTWFGGVAGWAIASRCLFPPNCFSLSWYHCQVPRHIALGAMCARLAIFEFAGLTVSL